MRIVLWIVLLVLGFLLGMGWKNRQAEAGLTESQNAVLVSDRTASDQSADAAPPIEYTPEELHTIRLFEAAAPSVCFITTSVVRRNYYSRNIQEIPRGSGSGFVWDRNGHIVTNFHVLQGSNKALVTLSDQTSYEAELVGYASEKDLAVLRINAPREKLTPIPVGASSNLRVGQAVYAIGNPFGLDQTLTTGVVSALGREIQSVSGIPIRDVIQSDAAINPGNSGGPLLDSSGKLIGVNTAIYSPSGASAGIGFSIPVDVVRVVVPDLIQYGRVNRPILGVELAQPLRNVKGAIVVEVTEGSPAARAGIRPSTTVDREGNVDGDVIVRVNNESIESNNDLILALEKYQAGDEVVVTVLRGGQERQLRVRLAESRQ